MKRQVKGTSLALMYGHSRCVCAASAASRAHSRPLQLVHFSPLTPQAPFDSRARVHGHLDAVAVREARRDAHRGRACRHQSGVDRRSRPLTLFAVVDASRGRSAAGGARCAVCWRTASRTRPSTTEQGRVLHTDGPSRRPESGRVRPSGPLERRTSASRGRHKRCGESQVCCLSV